MFFLWIALSCIEPKTTAEEMDSASDEIHLRYSIAVLADPHIAGGGEHSERLQQAVEWINQQQTEQSIELVVVLGDVGWGSGLSESKSLLDQLQVPYVPVIGDNEVAYGDEENFGTVYGPQFELLSTYFTDWNKDGSAVWNPEEEKNSWFYNYAFTYRGNRFITVDWSARTNQSIFSEMGDLHDFDGGTFEFFESEITALNGQKENSVMLLSHIPMYMSPGGFDVAEADKISGLTNAYSDLIYADFAGHFQVNADTEFEDGGFEVFITDAVWDDEITIRLVQVWEDNSGFSYVHEIHAS